MATIMVDGIKDIVFHNGIVRVDCLSAGPNGEQRGSGSILIPGVVAGPVLQILANAAKSEGVGMDGLAHSLTILTRMMAAAKGGSKDTAAAFKQLGVEVSDGRGHIRNADEVFLDLAEAKRAHEARRLLVDHGGLLLIFKS